MMNTRRLPVVALVFVAAASVLVVPVSAHTNEVTADPQVSANGTVVAEGVFVFEDSWLVIHRDANGSIGAPIGHTSVRPGSFRTDVPVAVTESVWRNWTGTRHVHLVLHHDDGDGQFEPDDDVILSTAGTRAAARIPVQKGSDPAFVGVARFDGAETNGSVTVRQASLPTDGLLVLERLGGDGFVVGWTTLAQGTHENVSLRIDETFYRRQPTEFVLETVLYRDDGDGQFDEDDRPVRAGDEPVASNLSLQRTDSRTPAVTPDENASTHTEATTADRTESDESDHDEGGGHDHEHDHSPEEEQTATPTDSPQPTATATTAIETSGDAGPGFGVSATLPAFLVAVWIFVRSD